MRLFALLLGLVTQISVVVKGPDQKLVEYGPQEEIVLPTDRYTCRTEPDRDNEHSLIQVVCSEKGKEVMNVAAICYSNKPDKNVAAFKLNVSKTDKPNFVFFMLGCRTVPDGSTTL